MNRRSRVGNAIAVDAICWTVGLLVILLVAIIVYSIVTGWGELSRPRFYTNVPTGSGSGVGPQIFNTVYLLVLTVILTIPTGLAAGIYFAEYAGDGHFTNMVRRATETLATLPSIVVGLFGYLLFVQAFHARPSRLAAALALTVISLPYAVRVTEDALRGLPPLFARGASPWGRHAGRRSPEPCFPPRCPCRSPA